MENTKERLYSVLLVDDEEDVVRVMMDKIDWTSLGFKLAGYAHNGVEALEMAEESMPDVVLTDIKMPFMDGLTLGRKLKERDGGIKLIIFSGFDEFEYAKEAIKLEVEEYLLKPVDRQELTEVFTRVRENLDKELDERENMDKLQDYYMESLPMLQESLFTSLLEGRVPIEQIPQYLQNYRLSMEGPQYLVSIVHISTQGKNDDMDAVLRQMQTRKILEEQIAPKYNARVFSYLRDIVVLAQVADQEEVTRYTDDMDNFCHSVKRFFDAPVTVGVGTACENLADLPGSYEGARQAISYRAIYGNSRAINIAEINPGASSETVLSTDYAEDVLRQIRLGDRESLASAVSECISNVTANTNNYEEYRIFLLSLVARLAGLAVNNGLSLDGLMSDTDRVTHMLLQTGAPEEVCKWLLSVAEKLQDGMMQRRESASNSFVTKAVEYVQQRYAENNISIETVCSELSVSAAYFSTVFKKETGKTFISYLTDYRMEQAVELLLTTDDKTYMIAEKVGYADPNYFSYVFKKQFGLSPSKYRQEKRGDRKAL